MKINSRILTVSSLIYLYLPTVLFLLGWTNKVIAIGVSIAIIFCTVRMLRNVWNSASQREDVKISVPVLVFLVLFFCWVGYYAGWGRWVQQAGDWHKHNAVLHDLVNKRWPVMYRNGREHAMLSYYIGYYLVPALIGKIRHSFRAAEIAMYAWGASGLVLVYLNLIQYLKARTNGMQVLSAVMIPFFGIPLWLSELVLKRVSEYNTLGQSQWFYFGDTIKLQYSSNYTLLRWVVPQVIGCWLILLLFLQYRQNIENYLYLMLPAMLWGTFSFLGIVPMAGAYAIEWGIRSKSLKAFAAKVFSVDNILMLFTQGAVLFLYYYGNVFSEKPHSVGLSRLPYGPDTWILYVVFVAVNVGIYAIILWRDHKTDLIYYAVVATLCILPAFNMGLYNDLMMRTSIPGLFILMIYVLEFAGKYFPQSCEQREEAGRGSGTVTNLFEMMILFLVLVGMYYPFHELSEIAAADVHGKLGREGKWESMEKFADREREEALDLKYNYYAYDIEDNLFYRYIADR